MGSKNLNEKIMECISNPAKSRLLIEIMRRGEVTAKYLAEKCSDIPQTTLYRNLKRMTDDGLLKIVNETPIRGTVEKTYALTFDPSDPPSVLGENSGAIYMQMFFQYFASINIALAVFNLVPIPPLDGYKIVKELFENGRNMRTFMSVERYATIILLAFLFLSNRLGIIGGISSAVLNGIQSVIGLIFTAFR